MYAEDGEGTTASPGTLWVCASDAGNAAQSGLVTDPVRLWSFNLMTGQPTGNWKFPAPTTAHPDAPAGINGFCNDMTLDAEGNVYVTDSWYPRILRLPKAGRSSTTPLEVWITNPTFNVDGSMWHLNGIDVDQANRAIYVVENHPGHLWRVPINTNGTAGTVQEITTGRTPSLGGPDGLKVIAPGLLATAESNGVSLIDVSGNTAQVTDIFHGFDGVATVALFESSVWIVENQGDHFWGPNTDTPADPPFRLVEVPITVGAGARNIATNVPRFFSEGTTVSGTGSSTNLYVGSMELGTIHRAALTATSTTEFIGNGSATASVPGDDITSVIGMNAHTASNRLYVCSSQTTVTGGRPGGTSLKAYNLANGSFIASWAWPAPVHPSVSTLANGFCNDITVSADGETVYATDSWYPRIIRLQSGTASTPPAASDTPTTWYTSTVFPQDQWHLNGLDLSADGATLYVVENHPGALYRIPITGGAGGTAVQITTSRPVRGPDGLKVIDADTLAIAEATGGMALIDLTGDTGAVRTVSTGLDGVATFALVGTNAWIVENQADHFWGASGPQTGTPNGNKPFRLVETPLGL
jgi:sugar lactone lactonase YvrE